MKWSEIHLKTLKEKPAGASIASHILLLRAGYIYNTSQGIYLYNTLFLRAIQKFEKIIREEMRAQGAMEILMPMVQTKELWEETGRWNKFEGLLLKMKNRTNQSLCLGPTHEETVTDFIRSGLASWRDMPLMLYQIQTKYRDEIRPRFGLMRAREFIMKDAYSFDRDQSSAQKSYQKMSQAYKKIFQRLGVDFVPVQADPGSIGGNQSQEFHIPAHAGEDEILISSKGDFAGNAEICPRWNHEKDFKGEQHPLEEFETPGIKSIQDLAGFLKCPASRLIKSMFFVCPKESQKYILVLCRGDDKLNPLKLKKELGLEKEPLPASAEAVQRLAGADPGSCGPWNLAEDRPIYLDQRLKSLGNFITGANKQDRHIKNVNPGRDFKVTSYGDFCYAKEGDSGPDKNSVLIKRRGIEVGHLFDLGDLYSKKMNLAYLDQQGKKQFAQMGCYGLGITRTLQALVEQNHDERGIIWPWPVAPCAIHICLIDSESHSVLKALEDLLSILKERSLDYFIDDRMERPGVKFKDADLLGLPFRINLGERDLKQGLIEVCVRKTGRREKLPLKKLKAKWSDIIKCSLK